METRSSGKRLPGWVIHLVILGVMVLVAALVFFFWSPGVNVRDGHFDLKTNGIWMQHGWFGDDGWFERNHKDPKQFRDDAKLEHVAEQLRKEHIKDVFPHLCPAGRDGQIAACDEAQVERFLEAFQDFRVMPWVGGVNKENVFLENESWRKTFVMSCASLLERHPRLSGIHLNIEPLRSGNGNYLLLLQELRKQIPKGKIISIAAYPPPSFWQQSQDVHWDKAYSKKIASIVDQVVVMMYDTSLRSPGLYEQQMKDWTSDVLEWYAPKKVLLGVPAYDDAGVGYHDPATENLRHSLRGINAGLGEKVAASYRGICVYSEWQMKKAKWDEYDKEFCSHP